MTEEVTTAQAVTKGITAAEGMIYRVCPGQRILLHKKIKEVGNTARPDTEYFSAKFVRGGYFASAILW
jgi:hypothetical protein